MRIILIDPPFFRFMGYYYRYFPLGLAYLAAVLRDDGHTLQIYDADCNRNATDIDYSRLEDKYPDFVKDINNPDHTVWQEARQVIREFSPDLVGITAMTTKIASAFKVASLCKELSPDVTVVMGGPHGTIKAEETLQIHPHIDFVIRGEGEVSFSNLVVALEKGSDPGQIHGLSYHQNEGIVHTANGPWIEDLDTIPFPARDMLMGQETYTSEDMGLMMTSRGCPYHCTYCATSIWGRRVRYRSVGNVVAEIKLVKERYGTRQFTFKDDSFTINKKRVYELCERFIEEGLDINWDCNTRVNVINEELLRVMKRAGCNSIKVGVESGSQRILDLVMEKEITHDQVREAARLFRKVGIHWTGYFMMGVPGETAEDVRATLAFMREVQPDFVSFSVYEAFPGTKLFDIGIERGLVQPDRTLEDYYTLLPHQYYAKDPHRQVDTIAPVEFRQLEKELKDAFHSYNMGLPRLFRRAWARKGVYLKDPKILLGDIGKFLGWVT
jgi:radical SAM superfamily enzyme YgiQ (UPF0313 family)